MTDTDGPRDGRNPDGTPHAPYTADDLRTQAVNNPNTDDALMAVFAEGARRRELRARTALATMRRYERRLVREAAVMGYILGYQHGNAAGYAEATHRDGTRTYGDDVPGDADIVVSVIAHCDSTSDLYPYIAEACKGRRRRVTRARLIHPKEPR